MDYEERLRMAECGEDSEEYQRFIQQPSGNMDDSGYFSVQVISSALEVWGLELVPYTSTEQRARDACTSPDKMQAFICNYKDHWFTIRRLGHQWFNLNSLLSKPELISNTYLALFLAQLQQEGYSIFVVFGNLPECEADKLLKINPAVPNLRSSVPNEKSNEDEDLQKALELSLASSSKVEDPTPPMQTDEEAELEEALKLSLQGFSQEESDSDSEESQLRKAMRMSLECKSNTPSAPTTPCADQEEIRRKRLAFIEKNMSGCSAKSE